MPPLVDTANLDLSGVVRPGDGVLWGQACAEPLTLVEALLAQRAALGPLEVFMGVNWSGTIKAVHADHLRLTAYCGAGHNRRLADAGALDICPYPYSQIGPLIRSGKIKCDVVLLQVSPPNARGEYSLGLDVEYLAAAIDSARCVVAEINQHVPWTSTERVMRAEDFAYLLRDKPGCYVWLGNGSAAGGCLLHSPHFDFNDAIIPLGIRYWVGLVERVLGKH